MMTKEDYKQLAVELRQMSGWLDEYPALCKRAADAIDELLEMAEERTSIIRVETPLGALIARDSGFGPENPGISIDLRRPDADQDLALDLVECTTEHNVEGRQIVTRVYPSAMRADPDDAIIHVGIEEYFRTEAAEDEVE